MAWYNVKKEVPVEELREACLLLETRLRFDAEFRGVTISFCHSMNEHPILLARCSLKDLDVTWLLHYGWSIGEYDTDYTYNK